MMDGGMRILQMVSGAGATVIRVFLFVLLWNRFVDLYSRRDKMKKCALWIVIILLILIGEVFELFFEGTWFVLLLFEAIVILIYVFVSHRNALFETIFSCGLYLNIRFLSYFAVNTMTTLISTPIMDGALMSENVEAYVAKWVDVLYLITYLSYVVVISLLILPVLIFVKKRIRISFLELCYLSVMNVAGIVLTRIMMSIAIFKTEDTAIILVDEKPELLWQFPVCGLLLYLGELSAIFIWQRYNLYKEQSQMYFVESMEKEAIKKRLEETENYYDSIRKVRHEMSNHLTTIKGLADGKHNDELSDYISGINEDFETLKIPFNTGNPVTDVVLGDKYRKAVSEGIKCDFTIQFDEGWGILVYDISIILSNILDNAIEASQNLPVEKREIYLKSIEKEAVVVFVCENMWLQDVGTVLQDKSSMWHGIGLENVKEIALRYNGAVDISTDNNKFIISIILKKNLIDTLK